MSSAPAVSVIVPVYNLAPYLEEAIGSVLGQTYGDLECLVVDDGSTDPACRAALQRCLDRGDPRLRLLRHPGNANRGVAAARNLALSQARGRYVAFLDGDDAWRPGKLAAQVAALEGAPERVGLCFSDFLVCETTDGSIPMADLPAKPNPWGGELARMFDGSPGCALRGMLGEPAGRYFNWVQSPTPLVRRSCFAFVPPFVGPPALKVQYEDHLMWLQLAARFDFLALPEAWALYRVHPAQFTSRFLAQDSTVRHFEGVARVVDLFLAASGPHLGDKWRAQTRRKMSHFALTRLPRASRELRRAVFRHAISHGYLLRYLRARWSRAPSAGGMA